MRRPHGSWPAMALGCVLIAAATLAQEGETETAPERRNAYGDVTRIFTGDIRVGPEEVRHGTVVNLGGDVVIDGRVTGDVVGIFGSVHVNGEVDGDVVAVLSDLEMRDARIEGQVVSVLGGFDQIGSRIGNESVHIGFPGNWFPGFWSLLAWLRAVRLVLVFVLLVLLMLLLPERVERIADAAPLRYPSALLVGALGYLALVLLLPLALATVIGLPVFAVAFLVAKWLGIAGIFCAVGRRAGRNFGRQMSPLGAVLLVFGSYAALVLGLSAAGVVGLIGLATLWLAFLVLFEIPGLGLVLLTRFGTRLDPSQPIAAPVPTAPVVPAAAAPAPAPPPV